MGRCHSKRIDCSFIPSPIQTSHPLYRYDIPSPCRYTIYLKRAHLSNSGRKAMKAAPWQVAATTSTSTCSHPSTTAKLLVSGKGAAYPGHARITEEVAAGGDPVADPCFGGACRPPPRSPVRAQSAACRVCRALQCVLVGLLSGEIGPFTRLMPGSSGVPVEATPTRRSGRALSATGRQGPSGRTGNPRPPDRGLASAPAAGARSAAARICRRCAC